MHLQRQYEESDKNYYVKGKTTLHKSHAHANYVRNIQYHAQMIKHRNMRQH